VAGRFNPSSSLRTHIKSEIKDSPVNTTVATHAPQKEEKGFASYYADKFHGKQTSSGETFDNTLFTAAHNTLPFGTLVKVTREDNQQSVIVKINDRGPFKPGRIIDLSRAAAEKINLVQVGTAAVKVELIGQEGIEPTTFTPSHAATQEVGTGLFKLALESHKGFGVQVASYQDFKTFFHAATDLDAKGYKAVMVHSSMKDELPIYRLILGPFESKAEAEAMLSQVAKNGVAGIVISLQNLK
jgi:rare lipoprotein A